jgi:Tol biopolymer transport system component
MKFIQLLTIVVLLSILIQCSTSTKKEQAIAYPEPKPDSTAITFLKGIASSDSLDFNAMFSPDGRSFFFSRLTNGKTHIFVSAFDGKNWGSPTMTSFSEPEFSEADPFITPDGTLYYISDRKRDAADTIPDFDIWMVHPQENRKWSAPENLQAVNSDSTEYYVSLADNKNLYFSSNRVGTLGRYDIYVSKFVDGKYTTPENLGAAVNAPVTDHDPFISRDEKLLIFTSKNRKEGFGAGDLYYSEKGDDGKWSVAKNMGKRFNTATYDFCASISRDSKYFFFSSENDIKWIDIKYLPHSFSAND